MEKLMAQLKALPPWQKYAILLIVPLILILYIWFMMITPSLDEKSKLEVDIKNTKGDIDSLKAGIDPRKIDALKKQEEGLREEYSKKYAELTTLVGEIPTEKDVGLILKNIGNLAVRSGVLILGMEVSRPERVEYYIAQEFDRKLVREVPKTKEGQQAQQQPAQQAQQQTKQAQQKVESVAFLKGELKLSLLGNYSSIRAFLEGLRKEGILSYPSELTLTNEGNGVKADINIYLLMKEGKEL